MQNRLGKRNIFIRATVMVLSAVFVALAITSPFIIAAVANDGRTVIVVDAGHGGADGGVTGVRTGAKESDLNLHVAKLLGEYLKSGGYKVVSTRHNDTMHAYAGIDNKKREDMFKRGDIINAAKPAAMISVHMNFYSASSRRGAQVFFDRKSESGREFANVMQNIVNAELNRANGGREYTALSAEKYLLSCSPYPSIIVECGFLSNPIDEANLVNSGYQAKLAYTLYLGIIQYLEDSIAA